MDGMKLGSNQKPKNSFAYQNQFIDNGGYGGGSQQDYDDQQQQDQYQNSSVIQPSNKSQSESLNISQRNIKFNKKPPQQHLNLKNTNEKTQSKIIKQSKQIKQSQKMQQQSKHIKQKLLEKSNKDKIQPKQTKNIQQSKQNKNDSKKQDFSSRISSLNNGIERLSVSIHQMKDNYNDLERNEYDIKSRSPRKQEQIKQYLAKKQAEKKILQQRKKIQMEKDQKRIEQQLRLEEIQKNNKQKLKQQQNLRRLNNLRLKRQVAKIRQEQNKKISSQLYENFLEQQKSNKKFHIRKMQEDQIKHAQQLKRRQRIKAQRKQVFKSIDYQEIQQHERKHQTMLRQLLEQKRMKREQQQRMIYQKNQQFNNNVYRGINYENVEQQIQQRLLKKKQPLQKRKKVKEYQQHVREFYIPKTHQPAARKSSQIKKNISGSLTHRQVKRYRYINGVAYGEIIQSKPLPKSEIEQKRIGNQNLAYLRSLPKKKNQTNEQPSLSPQDLAILQKKLNTIVKVKKQKNPLYDRHRSIQVKLSNNPTRDQIQMVFGQLKYRDQHTKMKQKLLKHQSQNSDENTISQRKINQEIVKNIEQKLNLLSKI